jgi:hypothetical protein
MNFNHINHRWILTHKITITISYNTVIDINKQIDYGTVSWQLAGWKLHKIGTRISTSELNVTMIITHKNISLITLPSPPPLQKNKLINK